MNRQELRSALTTELKKTFSNVDSQFVYPTEKAESQNEFPYITILFGLSVFDLGTRRYSQTLDIIAIDKGENDDLVIKQDTLIDGVFQRLHKSPALSVIFEEIDPTNLFKPFGLEAGLYPPYCGVRFRLKIPGALTI